MKSSIYIVLLSLVVFKTYGQTNQTQANRKISDGSSSLIKTEQITLQTALQLTSLARTKASVLGKDVSVAVLDAGGQIIVLTRGDRVGIHNTEAARRKAFTAASTKTATLVLARNARSNPDTENLASLPELLLLGGGVPLYHNGKVIGAIGIAGGGSPENDDLIGRSASITQAEIIAR
jgi:uncharacterized protein GlcG (DUF336 family)